jgi:hypothetical protein
MVQGSIAVPGALVMVNNDLTPVIQNRLEIQLHIDESITGQTFDLRYAADPNYPHNVRALRRRIMVIRDFRDHTNREQMDIVLFVKSGMISVTKNCFGPPGQTYLLKNIYWGAICIYNTDVNRTCHTSCCGGCGGTGGCGCDGYGPSPYYPAKYDPAYPLENHPYNQVPSHSIFGECCDPSPQYQLCRKYTCNSHGCVPQLDCRLVKA